jgi:serine/threonine protein kinase
MGEIFEAEHLELGRPLAIKVLHHHHLGRADLVVRLREEARLLGRLCHPNVVEVFDLGVTADGRPWFAMPLLRGRDLRDELSRGGPLPARRAAVLLCQALDGLAAAHAAGFVHRDVKLENLFLEEGGRLKVLDFGIAKLMDEGGLTIPGAPPGTPRTMSPEQCAGGVVDARADVYAAGLVLYELCAGRGPFDELRGNDHGLRFAHWQRRPLAPSALGPRPLPPGMDALILRALAKDPRDRFQSAAEMAAALRALFPAESPRPSIVTGARRRRRGRAGNPWIPATISALTVAGFALGLAAGRFFPVPASSASTAAITAPR